MNHAGCSCAFTASPLEETADSRCRAAVLADKKQLTHHVAPNARVCVLLFFFFKVTSEAGICHH